MNDELRTMPHNRDAERAILSCILQWPDQSEKAFQHPEGEQLFYTPALRAVYSTLRALHESREPIDLVTATTALRDSGALESVGGPSVIAGLLSDVPTPTLLPNYLRLASDSAKRRSIIQDCWRVSASAFDPGSRVEDLVQELDNTTQRIFRAVSTPKIKSMNIATLEAVEFIQERMKNGGEIPGLSYGLPLLDEATNGMQPGQMVVVAARPGKGKTSLALNFAEHLGGKGIPSGIFSAEMTATELVIRSLSAASGIDSLRLERGQIGSGNGEKFKSAVKKVASLPIWIDDRADMRLIDIQVGARQLVREHGVKVIVVDYLQLIREPEGSRNREDAVRRLSAGLKNLAKDLGITVIVVAQLNRGPERRADNKPSQSDLRDSGSIEQDANVILLLHAEDPKDDEMILDMEIIVAKCRGGRLGPIEVEFHRPFTTFKPKCSA